MREIGAFLVAMVILTVAFREVYPAKDAPWWSWQRLLHALLVVAALRGYAYVVNR
jgi:hypothetical protein